MLKLGIIGGLGPMATAYFLQLITQMSEAKKDQEHMEILLYSKPSIPDRTDYILGKSKENPLPSMVQAGKALKTIGADLLAVPCITAHFFHRELEKETGLPVLHAVEETASYLKEEGLCRIGLLATDGTLQSGLFQKSLEKKGMTALVPEAESQKKIMQLIYEEAKAGKEIHLDGFYQVSEELQEQGAQVILLACTELSLIKRDYPLKAGYLDVMEVLAREAVRRCGRLREEYGQLITEQVRPI